MSENMKPLDADTECESACKKPWYEYRLEMEHAQNTLRHSMGSYAFDNDFAHVKGYMEGYIAGMSKMEMELDL